MTPRGRGSPPKDGDNTPQGKLARGCMTVFWWIMALIVCFGVTGMVEDWACKGSTVDKAPWYCPAQKSK